MRVVIAGASGFLGTHLSDHLRVHGHEVTALVRREPTSARESHWDPSTGKVDAALVGRADAVVNLAGASIAGNPHSKKWSTEVLESRVSTTRVLADAIAASERKPAFLAGNGIAWYGDHGDAPVTEESDTRGDGLPHPGLPRVGVGHGTRARGRRPGLRAPHVAGDGPDLSPAQAAPPALPGRWRRPARLRTSSTCR